MNNSVWVTGAGSGIGFEIVKLFLSEKINVFASSRNINSVEFVGIQSDTTGILTKVPLDIKDKQSIYSAYSFISKNGGVDCLINCAGTTSFSKAESDSTETIDSIIQTNLLGSIYSIKAVLNDFIQRKDGTIINILSVVTQKVLINSSAYSASKAGLLAYSKVLREEVREHNIRVIDIIPGATITPIWPQKAQEKYSYRMMNAIDIAEIIKQGYLNKSSAVQEEIVIRPILGDI